MSLTPVGDLGIALKSDVDDFHKGMRTSKDSVGLLTGSIRGLSAAMRNMGIAVTAASALSGAAMLTLSRRAERVSAAFREVNSISRDGINAQEEYGDLVSELNTEFGLQASQLDVIGALYQSVSAGVEQGAEAQREFLETAADLAVVGLVDLESSVDVLSTAINAYGEDTEFAEEAATALFQTVQFGKVTLDELAPVMGRITALGAEMNVSIQDLGASMAVLTRTGFEARVAATGLRAILRSFMRPSEEMKSILRDIALENDLFADSMGESGDAIRNLASDFREAEESLRNLEEAQKDVRRSTRENSLVIQEARLLQTAIERDAREEAEETIRTEELKGKTYEELDEIIDDYAFKVEDLRVQEEQLNLDHQELKERTEELRNEFSEMVGSSGDLEGGLGQLVLENQGFVDTLIEVRERADEQGESFSDLFPRTRALQGALALVGEDGQLLKEIFEDLADGTIDARERWEEMDEATRDNFESFEEFEDMVEEMETFDLEEEADDMRDNQEAMRDATSQLAEAATRLGEVFNDDLTEALTDLADFLDRAVDKFEEMEESTRGGIGRFAVLATSIGLVLGPLLLLGGQLALIATAMGSKFIPFLLIAGGLLGGFASSLSTAASGGEEADNLFGRMSDTLSGLIGFIFRMGNLFRISILPALKELAGVAGGIFSQIAENIMDMLNTSDSGPDFFNRLFWAIQDSIEAVTAFLEENEELIVMIGTELAGVLINDVIPAFIELAKGIWAVFRDFDWSILGSIVALLVGMAQVLAPVVGWIGRWLQRNSELVATMIKWAIIIGVVVTGIIKLVVAIGKVAAIVGPLISQLIIIAKALSAIYSAGGIVVAMKAAWYGIALKLTAMFPMIAKGVAVIVKGLVLLGKGITVIVGLLSAKVIIIAAVVAAIVGLVAAVWIARDQIVAGWRDAWNTVRELFGHVIDFLRGDISFREMGRSMMDSLAQGLRDGIDNIRDAIGEVTGTISEYLPSSPAQTGPLARKPPGDSGRSISTGMAEGMMDGIDDIEDSSEFLAESSIPGIEDMEYDVATPSDHGGGMGGGFGKEKTVTVNFNEKSVKIGPFEGISDEEMPAKVRDEVNAAFEEEIIEKIEGRGEIEPPR